MASKDCRKSIMDFVTGRPNATQLCTLKLFKNNLTVDDDTVLADLTEANFNGYAAVTNLNFPDAVINGSDQGEVISRVVTTTKNSGGTGNTLYGWYITRKDADNNVRLVEAENFAAPIDFTVDTAEFQRTYILRDSVLA